MNWEGALFEESWCLSLLLLCGLVFYPSVEVDGKQIHQNGGTRAMSFLKIGVGAKGIGMGAAQVADTNDLYASYWNPAGLAKVERPHFGLMHNEWFEGINHEFIGFVQPISNAGAIGGSLVYLSFGEILGRDARGKETHSFRPYDLAIILSYGRWVGSCLAFGANVKWVREQIDTESAQVVAFDVGGMYSLLNRPISFGFNVQHLGTKVKFIEDSFNLPTNIRIGGSYKLLDEKLSLTADCNLPSDNDVSAGFGLGISASRLLQLRIGYKYLVGGNDLGAASGITGGVGFKIEGFQIDYAFVSFGRLGPSHRFSLISDF